MTHLMAPYYGIFLTIIKEGDMVAKNWGLSDLGAALTLVVCCGDKGDIRHE